LHRATYTGVHVAQGGPGIPPKNSVVPSHRRRYAGVALACALISVVTAAPARADVSFTGEPATQDGLRLPARVAGPSIELATPAGFQRRFWPGVNLGSTIPGHQPGEVAATRRQYDAWLDGMGDLGVRVVRVYTILRPDFYDALAAYNAKHAAAPIYFMQGIWLPGEEDWYAHGDAYAPGVTDTFRAEIDDAVAVVHGRADLPQRPGHAGGTYRSDVARWLLAWSPGIEWDPTAVKKTDELNAGRPAYDGRYLDAAANATPMESWIASMLDHVATLDARQGWSRPITFTNWLTADPLEHPEEPIANEDDITVDAKKLSATGAWPGGFFASYHAYPYYPDFLRLQPGYLQYARARDGRIDPYAGYLNELRRHHGDQAVMITEFGVPTGNGVAHLGPLGRDQGDHSEQEAGRINADLLRDIADEGYAGGVLFEWADEWFKTTWNTQDTDFPRDRRQLWRNVLTNEEQFGVIAAEPGRKPAAVVDGRDREWKRNKSRRLARSSRGPVREIRAVADASYLHLLVRSDARKRPLTIGFDVRPGSNKGLPGTKKAFPQAEVAITLGRGRRATIAHAAWTDPLLHQYGPGGLGMVPANSGDLRPGSGVWTRPTLMLNRSYTVPSTGERRPVELKDLGDLPWGTGDPRARRFDVRTLASGSGSLVELRIPWALLGFADPSSRSVLMPAANGTFTSRTVRSIRVAAAAPGERLVRARALPLKSWNTVQWHERRKAGWPTLRAAFGQLAER
jgi:hypothetical protein